MSEIRDGDVCEACGETVRRVTTRATSLAGPDEIVQSWDCGCNTLAGPQVARLKAQ